MILFRKDWLRFPSAIIDTQTTNTSFLRLAQVYREMGVQNNAFLLTLLQPHLQGVSPFDPNLSLQQKADIGMECRYNPWYFFRELARLEASGAAEPVQFRANRGNIALIWTFLNHIDSALIQPRQTHKSGSVDCLSCWILYVGAIKTKMMLLTKDDKLRVENIERLKGIRNSLPPYLINITSDDSDNKDELTCKSLSNKYITGVARSSEMAANNLGRGVAAAVLQSDEGPFCTFIGVTLPAALASGTAARDQAAGNNQPYGNIFTTTAGKKDSRDGRYMYDFIHAGAVWNEAFYDAVDLPRLHEMIRLNRSGRRQLVNITMSHRQLGYTDEWLYDKITNSNGDGEAAERDFLNVWTSGTQRSPLTAALNEIIRNSDREPNHIETSRDGYMIRWYISPEELAVMMEEGHIVIGADTSEAVGRDSIALVFTDIRTLADVGVGTYNETNLIRFATYLAHLLIKYQRTTLVIERKSTGMMIIDLLTILLPKAGIDPFKRVFNKIVEEAGEKPDEFKAVDRYMDGRSEAFYDLRKTTFGFSTNAQNRMFLYTTVLQNAAKQAGHLVRDKMLSNEIRGLVEKNGRIDHNESGHDDHVIAWLLTHWFLSHARNLHHYGIDTSEVMSAMTTVGREITDEEIYAREQQALYLDEIDMILDKLKETSDELMVAKLELRLRYLGTRVQLESSDEMGSVDALIRGAAEERAKRLRIRGQQQRNGGSGNGNREITIRRPTFLGRRA